MRRDDLQKSSGPRGHHADAIGQHRGFVERVGDEQDRSRPSRATGEGPSSPISRRVCWSSAPNGSSSRIRRGCSTSVRAMQTRCRMPPDNWAGYASANALQARELQRVVDAAACRVRVDLLAFQAEGDVLAHGQPREARVFLKDHANTLGNEIAHGGTVEKNLAVRGPRQSRDDFEQRGLTAPGRSDHREELARAHREVERPQRVHVRHAARGRKDLRHRVDGDEILRRD
jgi:hypothetical protein